MAANRCKPTSRALLALGAAALAAPTAGLQYSQARADQFVRLAGAAYCSDNLLTSWSCAKCIEGVTDVQVCHGLSTRAYVAHWDGQCLAAFEGTAEISAVITDLQFLQTATEWDACGNCKVHGGFLDEWRSLQGCVTQQLNALGCPAGSHIRTTGHSLGAALNALAMIDLTTKGWVISESYDFGMPRTGDSKFASTLNNKFGDRSFRVTHRMDPVIQLPPDRLIVDWHFEHKEPEVFYDGSESSGYTICSSLDDPSCSKKYWNVPIDVLFLADHLVYLGVQTNPLGCGWGSASNATGVASNSSATVLV